jgi:hypothetical protein
MTPEIIERIKSIKRRHEEKLLALDGVVAVGIGTTSNGAAGLIVSVKKDVPAVREGIPKTIEGTPVEIRETGEMKAQ